MMPAGREESIGAGQGSGRVPWVVIVGGFLGAGKTTLIVSAARELAKRGLKSAAVLNDQSEGLVDSAYATLQDVPNDEVTGGCFCCRFSDLVHALERMRAYEPDVIFAEPVGSCADISATLLHPLEEHGMHYRLALYSVLVDPERARELLGEDADEHLAFLFSKQVAEADLICFTKADLAAQIPDLGARSVRQLSARSGQGVAAWLDEVLQGEGQAGGAILDIDYEEYARAEAALAWLNLHVTMRPALPTTPACVLGPLLDAIDSGLTRENIAIVHLKAIVRAESGFVKAALCGNRRAPQVEGMLDASPAWQHELLLNLRCAGDAARTREVVEFALREQDVKCSDLRVHAFHPAPPRPERRMSRDEIARKRVSVSAN